jgi:hypothetical protein
MVDGYNKEISDLAHKVFNLAHEALVRNGWPHSFSEVEVYIPYRILQKAGVDIKQSIMIHGMNVYPSFDALNIFLKIKNGITPCNPGMCVF